MNLFSFLAEILPQTEPFWDYSRPPEGMAAAGIFFLLLMCMGIAVDAGLTVYFLKRPANLMVWRNTLAVRILPPKAILALMLVLAALYAGTSALYALMIPGGSGLDAPAVIMQTLCFHVPGLVALVLLVRQSGFSFREQFGFHLKKAPAFLGAAVLLYLAALPLLWFYSMLYQIFLHQLGHGFYLQDVAQLLLTPAPWPVRGYLLFTVVVLAPVFEELVFRGVLLPFFVNRAGLLPGIALLSLLFAGLHLHIPSLVPLFLLSAVFSLAYARTRSLLVPIGMHILFNSVTVMLLLLPG
jgi:membrane protease YdiL (CAAX protease family)